MRWYWPRLVVMTGVAGALAASAVLAGGLVATAARPSGFANPWRTAQELPGIGALNKGGESALLALSCGSPGNCAGGGYYSGSGGNRLAFVADERKGTWHAAMEVPGIGALSNGGDDAEVLSLSCPSAGNCAAGGTYRAGSGYYQAFVVTEKNGKWGKATIAPGTKTLNKLGNAAVQSVSCGRAGDCAAGGYYHDGTGHGQAFVIDSANGIWKAAKEVPGLATLNKGSDAQLLSVSCAAAGACSAGGFYVDGSAGFQGFVVTETNGKWGSAREVPGLGTLNGGGFAKVNVVSCASAGSCAAGGLYHVGPTQVQAFIVTQAKGKWGTAEQVPGTALLNAGEDAQVTSVACASPGNCSVAGSYTDNLGHTWPFVITEKNAKWGKAVQAPGVSGLSGLGRFGEINSVSCASAGNCAAAGQYNGSTGYSQAFLIVQHNGTWSAATKVPGLPALNKGNADAAVVSCHAPAGCTAGGYYHDIRSNQQVFVVATR